MRSHPLIFQPSIRKRSGQTRAFREATERQNQASIAAYRSNFVNATFFVRLKITDQSRGVNFRMWSHPLICQPSICKRRGRIRAFREATKRQNRASIAAIGAILSMLLFSPDWKSLSNPGGWIFGCDPIHWYANRLCKRSGRIGAFREATKLQNRASIAA